MRNLENLEIILGISKIMRLQKNPGVLYDTFQKWFKYTAESAVYLDHKFIKISGRRR